MVEAGRPYELHRTILRAFPGREQGGAGHVLYRLDVDPETGSMSVLVQCQKEPNWRVLEEYPGFLADSPSKKEIRYALSEGQVLYFRLRANPTVKRDGKRWGLYKEEEQMAWLKRKAAGGGFEIVSLTVIPEGKFRDGMTDEGGIQHDLVFCAVRFEGILRVVDPEAFFRTLERGIGSAKGLGFGLLSVAPIRG
jgi:CRISPR system Cascade subunit CasE